MIRHFFLDKSCTIVKGKKYNTGLNPILKLNYGNTVSRGIIHFDTKEIESLICNKTFSDLSKLTFKLKMTNCMSVDDVPYDKNMMQDNKIPTRRASSFDLIAYEIPQEFDAGRGFSFEGDFWIGGNEAYTEHGCNWYFSKDGKLWKVDEDKVDIDKDKIRWNRIVEDYGLNGGIYSEDELNENVKAFNEGKDSLIIDMQHFDFGQENLDMDITKYVLDVCLGKKKNNGICISFAPVYEKMELFENMYAGFFTDHTNTFFHPYVEAIYDVYIEDDRQNFNSGRENKLYFYSMAGGDAFNLDENPVCTINETEYEVKQATKGVYFASVGFKVGEVPDKSICYDVWSGLKINGEEFDDVENEFVVGNNGPFFGFGDMVIHENTLVPSLSGINDAEKLNIGETREVIVDFRRKYTTDKKDLVDSAEYKLYVTDGDRDYDVIDFTKIEKSFLNNYFVIYTGDLIPHKYKIDIKVTQGRNVRYFKKVLEFEVVSNVTERYE